MVMSDLAKNDYIWEGARFKSFKKWPFSSQSKCASIQMARAGWYSTNDDPKDPSARCAYCLKELNGWEVTDDPWVEHAKHSGQCLFVVFGKKEDELSVKEMIRLIEQRVLKIMELEHKEGLKDIEEEKRKIFEALEKVYGS